MIHLTRIFRSALLYFPGKTIYQKVQIVSKTLRLQIDGATIRTEVKIYKSSWLKDFFLRLQFTADEQISAQIILANPVQGNGRSYYGSTVPGRTIEEAVALLPREIERYLGVRLGVQQINGSET